MGVMGFRDGLYMERLLPRIPGLASLSIFISACSAISAVKVFQARFFKLVDRDGNALYINAASDPLRRKKWLKNSRLW
jgi:hypothetical protein